MEPPGRFYTSKAISGLLVSKFRQESPRNILDIGAGDGSLLIAAYNRWKNATFHAADIDPESIAKISKTLPFVRLQHINGLSTGLDQKMNLKVNSVDVAICNPPYLRIKNTPQTMLLLRETGFVNSLRLKRLTSDIVFLAQNLFLLKAGGELEAPLYISKGEALQRMDYSYYWWKSHQRCPGPCPVLGDMGVEIKRGRGSKKVLSNAGIKFFHTSSFSFSNPTVKLENSSAPGELMAEPVDILISRVGKRCIGRVALVESGTQVISDCIYRLGTPAKYREIIWKALVSPGGKKWMEAHAHGVCSRCLSKKDLLAFPIPL